MKNKKLVYGAAGAVVIVAVIGGIAIGTRSKKTEEVAATDETTVQIEEPTTEVFTWEDVPMEDDNFVVRENTSIYSQPRFIADVVSDIETGKEGIAFAYCIIDENDVTGWYMVKIGASVGYMSSDYFDFAEVLGMAEEVAGGLEAESELEIESEEAMESDVSKTSSPVKESGASSAKTETAAVSETLASETAPASADIQEPATTAPAETQATVETQPSGSFSLEDVPDYSGQITGADHWDNPDGAGVQ